MKITKREVVFVKLDHTPPLRVVQQDWERDAEDERRERQMSSMVPSLEFNSPKSGYRLVVEVARAKDGMGDLMWTELAIA